MDMEFYSTRQIAQILGIKTITVRRWIKRRLLPAYKIGKELRVNKADLDQFIADKKI